MEICVQCLCIHRHLRLRIDAGDARQTAQLGARRSSRRTSMVVTVDDSKQVVIIGGGAAGMATAKALCSLGFRDRVTIVQANAFTEMPIFVPYFLSRPGQYAARLNKKNGTVNTLECVSIPGVKYAVGTVMGIEETQVVLADSSKIAYDALVVAVGVGYPAIAPEPGESLETRTAFVESFPQKICAAKSILIGGGGPVAMEMAAEVRKISSSAKVTVVTSASSVLGWTGEAADVVAGFLKAQSIEVITGERLNTVKASFEPATYTLSSGKTLEADIYLPYFGEPRTGFVANSVPGSVERGRIKVNTSGQSTVKPNLFAVGCSDKYKALVLPVIEKDSVVVASNVAALLNQKPLAKALPEKPPGPPDVMWVHLGLGQFTVMNMAVAGPGPAAFGKCCGLGNPLCPCCCCLGYCCSFPAGSLPSKVMEKMLLDGQGNPHKPHSAKAPAMVEMQR